MEVEVEAVVENHALEVAMTVAQTTVIAYVAEIVGLIVSPKRKNNASIANFVFWIVT